MERTARLILAITMTSVMVLAVTLVATLTNLGLRPDFVAHWVKAYFIAWPVAAGTGFLIMPTARRVTDRIVALMWKA